MLRPLFGTDEIAAGEGDELPAIFTFQENLATVGDETAPLEIEIVSEVAKLELFTMIRC